jgi:hypothetical protein
MNSAEWMARLQLGSDGLARIWPEMGAKGPRGRPGRSGTSRAGFVSDDHTASGLDSVTEQESGSAENYLREHLSDERLSADVKIQAYHALYFAKDREAAKAYLEQSVAREQDQRVVRCCAQLLCAVELRLP